MSTRTYDRETISYDRTAIDILVEAGRAVYFPGLPGYVIDKKTAVRNHQIIEAEPVISDEDHQANLDFLRSKIADEPVYPQAYLAKAEELGISVGELTDGEYRVVNGIVRSTEEVDSNVLEAAIVEADPWASKVAEEDALLAKFGL